MFVTFGFPPPKLSIAMLFCISVCIFLCHYSSYSLDLSKKQQSRVWWVVVVRRSCHRSPTIQNECRTRSSCCTTCAVCRQVSLHKSTSVASNSSKALEHFPFVGFKENLVDPRVSADPQVQIAKRGRKQVVWKHYRSKIHPGDCHVLYEPCGKGV